MRKFLLLILVSCNLLFGFNELTEFKLKLLKKYKPESNWTFLTCDESFSLKYDLSDSFIRQGTCVEYIEGQFYIIDNNLHKLIVFDKNGRFVKKVGQQGKGPGDLFYPGRLVYNNDAFYISGNNGIEVFAKDLKFKNRIRPFLTIHKFCLHENNIYCNTWGSYRDRYPLILKLDDKGKVLDIFCDEVVENSYLRKDKSGIPILLKNHVLFIPYNWNAVYILDTDLSLKQKIKVKYDLLDKIEKWNDRSKKESNPNRIWLCNMFISAKVLKDKLYILLGFPHLEILQIDMDGNIEEHFHNDTDFGFMIWTDFTLTTRKDKVDFYVLGFSAGEDKGRDLSEFGLYKMVYDSKKTAKK